MAAIKGSGKEGKKCSFCGEENATAFWDGPVVVFCCNECATSTLPKLIADALDGGYVRALWDEKRVLLSFWRGVAHRIEYENHKEIE